MQLTSAGSCAIINHVAAVMQQTKYKNADMAESADALASGASPRKGVEVQVLLSALLNDSFQKGCRFSFASVLLETLFYADKRTCL